MNPPSPEIEMTFSLQGGDCVREEAIAQGRATPSVCWPSELAVVSMEMGRRGVVGSGAHQSNRRGSYAKKNRIK